MISRYLEPGRGFAPLLVSVMDTVLVLHYPGKCGRVEKICTPISGPE